MINWHYFKVPMDVHDFRDNFGIVFEYFTANIQSKLQSSPKIFGVGWGNIPVVSSLFVQNIPFISKKMVTRMKNYTETNQAAESKWDGSQN